MPGKRNIPGWFQELFNDLVLLILQFHIMKCIFFILNTFAVLRYGSATIGSLQAHPRAVREAIDVCDQFATLIA